MGLLTPSDTEVGIKCGSHQVVLLLDAPCRGFCRTACTEMFTWPGLCLSRRSLPGYKEAPQGA